MSATVTPGSAGRADDVCERITRSRAQNFYYGIRLLPPDKRRALCAVYAFARRVDDIGDDGDAPATQRLAGLAAARAAVATLDAQDSDLDPVLAALAEAVERYALPRDALADLVAGVEMDVRGAGYATFDELVAYCRHVAGSIGRLCLAVFAGGRVDPETDRLADDLGVAMQLTNVVRDIREDRTLGRVYLPLDDLRRHGVPDDPLAGEPAALAALVRFEAERAARWFDRALVLTERLDARSAACVLAMTSIYRRILERIVRDPGAVARGRVSLPPWEKGWVAASSLAAAGARGGGRVRRARPS